MLVEMGVPRKLCHLQTVISGGLAVLQVRPLVQCLHLCAGHPLHPQEPSMGMSSGLLDRVALQA